ncbi:MAG: hypoxanthine phosphoribosyltransferase [Clostridia bacterium]|jgi:hypoxanthine phosphoribosyltransferase|nr:hypoxanthine phosphoribosyltransferase [Clostridia bacterium]
MNKDVETILFTEDDIAREVKKCAAWLDERYQGAMPLAVSVLKGSVIFFCDLVRAMNTPVQMDFMTMTSYGASSQSSGVPKIVMDLAAPVEGRDVLLVEDIVDSGHTLVKMRALLEGRGAKSFTVVTLLDKPSRRQVDVKADYSCFEVGNEFIVGYGLDYAQQYRNLPYVGILKRSVYEK